MISNCSSALLVLTLIFHINTACTQTFSKIGLKGGFAISGLSTFNQNRPFSLTGTNLYIYDESDYFNFFSLDIGIFTEWFNSEEFCVSAELHYMMRGETDKTLYTVPKPNKQGTVNEWETGNLDDKANYISIQILPRYRVGISEKGEDNVYLFAGPTLNIQTSNNSSYSGPAYIDNRGPFGDFGAAFGIGFETDRTFSCEVKLDYSLTGSYDFKYGNEKVTRRYNSFYVLTGIALSEFFRK